MQLQLSYSTNERIHRESLLFIYAGESPTTTAAEELCNEEVRSICMRVRDNNIQHNFVLLEQSACIIGYLKISPVCKFMMPQDWVLISRFLLHLQLIVQMCTYYYNTLQYG